MNDKKSFLSFREAVKRLPPKGRIHTFRQAGPMLVGADWDRRPIRALLKRYDGKIEETGPAAMGMKHGLAVIDEDGALFIETV